MRNKESQKEWTQTQIRRSTLERLKKKKVHPRQTYDEVIEKLLDKDEEKNDQD